MVSRIEGYVSANAGKLGLSPKNLKITRFKSAYSNLVYRVISGRKSLVLKVITDPFIEEKKIAEKELLLLRKFREISPKVILANNFNGHPAIFEEFISGPHLAGKRLTNNDLKNIAKLLADIHSAKIDSKTKNMLSRDYVKVPGENLENIVTWLEKVDRKNIFAPRIIRVYERIKNRGAANLRLKKAICHGDFKLLNIIKTPNGLKTFDWELALIGDPAWEVAVFFYAAEHKFDGALISKRQLKTFLREYLALRPDPEFEKRMKFYYKFVPLQAFLWSIRDYFAIDFLKKHGLVSRGASKEKIRKNIEKELKKLEARWL